MACASVQIAHTYKSESIVDIQNQSIQEMFLFLYKIFSIAPYRNTVSGLENSIFTLGKKLYKISSCN